MQGGLVARRLTFRDVFTAVSIFFSLLALFIRIRWRLRGLVLCLAAA